MKKVIIIFALMGLLMGCSKGIHYKAEGEVYQKGQQKIEHIYCYNWDIQKLDSITDFNDRFILEGTVEQPTLFTGTQDRQIPFVFIAEKPGKIKLDYDSHGMMIPSGTALNDSLHTFLTNLPMASSEDQTYQYVSLFLSNNQNLAGAYALYHCQSRGMLSSVQFNVLLHNQGAVIQDFLMKIQKQ